METQEAIGRIPFLTRVVEFLKKCFTRKKVAPIEIISKFKIILDEMGKSSPDYEVAYSTVILCEEALRITKQRILQAEKIKGVTDKLSEVECFERLSADETQKLQNLLTHFLSLSKERSSLMHQITSFDASLSHILKLEGDISQTASATGEAEEYRRVLKQDLGYLSGEKAELEYERDFLESSLMFIRKFTIFMVTLFALAAIVMAFLFMFRGSEIVFPAAVLTIFVMVVIFIIFIFRRRVLYELKLNEKKQTRAVSLINKKTAVFAHYTNYLNFVYKKYRVRNAQMLKKNIKDVESYKHLTGRLDNIRNILYQTQDQIEDFLRKKNIAHLSSSIEHFAQTINVMDKKKYYTELIKELNDLEKTLSSLDARHEDIWDALIGLNDADSSKSRVIDRIIHAYLEEAQRVFAVSVVNE